ncbi:MAG: hypothetical protein H7039_23850 [Bryobacteraceae bacterium]|nr:hypothetical protein [Bryobacteraceae bacterium]
MRSVFLVSRRIAETMWWLGPLLICLAIYWYGLKVWFQMDDFAWLNLATRIHDGQSFLDAMFRPLAQGTIRPLSERLFFFIGFQIAGMESAPVLRAVVFATQCANLVLLALLTRKLTGSRIAGFAAPALWICNSNLYVPMAWTASYNQILCSFFLLLALLFWIRFIETRKWLWYWLQLLVFIIGFGALELNVVYPAIAALYAFCFARQHLIHTVPLFAISAAYTFVHRAFAPVQSTEIYRMYFDGSLAASLLTYLRWTFGVERYATFKGWLVWPHQAIELLVGLSLLVFVIVMLRRRQWLALFATGWFFIVLAPVLPLRNHVTDYYLTIPVIGLAILGGWALSKAYQRGPVWFTAALLLALIYMVPSAAMARGMTIQYYMTSSKVRTFVRSVARAHQLHPKQTIVVRHVGDDMFWAAWWDNPFQIFGRKKIFVAADDEAHIVPFAEIGSLSRHFLSEQETLAGMRTRELVVYELLPEGRLRNVSEVYRETLARDEHLSIPKYIGFGPKESEVFLREGWWEPEGNFRWTSGRSTFVIRGHQTAKGQLVIAGSCPPQHMAKGPLQLTVSVDNQKLPVSKITSGSLSFEFRYPMPASALGRPSVLVSLEVDRTLEIPGDKRLLGLIIASAEVVH